MAKVGQVLSAAVSSVKEKISTTHGQVVLGAAIGVRLTQWFERARFLPVEPVYMQTKSLLLCPRSLSEIRQAHKACRVPKVSVFGRSAIRYLAKHLLCLS